MSPSRARGRPRSEERRDAVLKAAMELMQEDDLRRASVDRISARSGVSKATIYKWWPNRTAVAIDAFLHQMMADAPVPDTGSAAEDFRLTLRGMMGSTPAHLARSTPNSSVSRSSTQLNASGYEHTR